MVMRSGSAELRINRCAWPQPREMFDGRPGPEMQENGMPRGLVRPSPSGCVKDGRHSMLPAYRKGLPILEATLS